MMGNQIPKIIHYCWFGGKEIPERECKCMKSWQKMLSDYQFMLWNEESFDINSTEWTKTAYEAKKYAFVSDYVRLWALNKYGGVYLDTDVKVLKSFDSLLNQDMFWCFEDVAGEVVASCTFGAVHQHPFVQEILEYYNQTFDLSIIEKNEANVIIITEALKRKGLRTDGRSQKVDGIQIYSRDYFCPIDFWGNWHKTDNTYSIHYFSASWLPEKEEKKHKMRTSAIFLFAKRVQGFLKNVGRKNR